MLQGCFKGVKGCFKEVLRKFLIYKSRAQNFAFKKFELNKIYNAHKKIAIQLLYTSFRGVLGIAYFL